MATITRRGTTLIITSEFLRPGSTWEVARDGTVTGDRAVNGSVVTLVIRTLTDEGYTDAAAAVHNWWTS